MKTVLRHRFLHLRAMGKPSFNNQKFANVLTRLDKPIAKQALM